MGLSESPCGVPIIVLIFVFSEPHVMLRLVLARRNLISFISSLSTIFSSTASSFSLLMVSNALDRSIPRMVNDS